MISFPFRLGPTGSVATVEQGSDTEIEEEIAVAMLTRPGERIQVPSFGVADPAFSGFVVGALQRQLIDFGPDVTITQVSTDVRADGRQQATISWRLNDQPKGVPNP